MKPESGIKNQGEAILVERDSQVLRQVAREVPLEDIGTKKLGSILAKMKQALHAEDDGVAIAAPQIGESLRIFMVKGDDSSEDELLQQDQVFINPEIIKRSQKKHKVEEGCLSLRYLYGSVNRHEKVTLVAWNELGEKLMVGASGLVAQIFQHETDHLNGILFTDKAENVRDMPPEPEDHD